MSTVFFDDTMIVAAGAQLHNRIPNIKGTGWQRHGSTPSTSWRSDGSGFYPEVLGAMLAKDQPLSAEYDIECDFNLIDGFGNAGIIARASLTQKTYYHLYYESGEWNLIKWINGLSTNLWTLADSMSGTVRVKFEVRNATKKLFVNEGSGYGTAIFTSTDNQISAKGYVGLRSAFQYGDSTGTQFSYFTATDTADPPGRPRKMIL